MYFVYVLQSLRDKKLYIGMSKKIDRRVRQQRGMSKSRLRKIENEVISKTGIDFYFHDE